MNSVICSVRGLVLFALLDAACAGLGMGVPLLCIGLGLLVGWRAARRLEPAGSAMPQMLRRLLVTGALTSAFTFLMMLVIWGPCLAKLWENDAELANFGMPMLLFEPRPSFIAWLALMVLISPFLQFLMTLFGSCVTLAWRSDETHALA
ncbi:MAG: hypothetical protein NTZ09_01705 [Candidatus Hydrogenedentes bacterium]|nr:hypothetical protein [Candidatus Hydrogenedentota bacterium]